MTRSEAGSASIYVLAGALLVGVAAVVPLVTGAAAVARGRAAVAADLAALAGARTLAATGSPAAACLRAAALAGANGAAISSCVAVACPPPSTASLQVVAALPVLTSRVSVTARAGPAACLAKQPPAAATRRSLRRAMAIPAHP